VFSRFRKENLRQQSLFNEAYEIRIELLCEILFSSMKPCYLSRGKQPSINLLTTLEKVFPGTGCCEKGRIARHLKEWRTELILKIQSSHQLGHKF